MWKAALWISLLIIGCTSALNGNENVFRFASEKDVGQQPAFPASYKNSTACLDRKHFCPGNQTCCRGNPPTTFACCPYIQGVCCPDGLHCCPKGSHCDMVHKRCYRQTSLGVDIFVAEKNKPALDRTVVPETKQGEGVECPDHQSQCPDGNTCCLLASGSYGCCPIPHAVCCSDHIHCCPNGYTCDVSAGTCMKGNDVISFLTKAPAVRPKEVESVKCNDGSTCPDGNTCCMLASGGYGCCPIPQAVCCSDHIHCCPNGYTCDVSAGTCNKGNDVISFLTKTPAVSVRPKEGETVICPGGQSQCPDGNTCCKLASGQWACCPIPEAVCCSDHIHCCPNGYTCDVSAGTCNKGNDVISFLTKSPSVSVRSKEGETITCQGGEYQCPDGNTCCKLASGQWGCCPVPNAVCCSDHVHCCPHGYTCNGGSCARGNDVIPFLTKSLATEIMPKEGEGVPCPGGEAQCPDGNTCCKLASGDWGCCPLPDAVCCSDHIHCCPNGYTCGGGSCSKGNDVIPFLTKSLATEIKPKEGEGKPCPGGTASCPDGNTCCKLASGQWGCCPLPNAVCCPDGVHCCPNGYTCNAGSCSKGSDIIPFLTKSLATEIKHKNVESVICPGGQEQCPDGNTCCKLASGQWGCCPLPEAVCCSDRVHCCPNGYSCSGGSCNKGSDVLSFLTKTLATKIRKENVEGVVCPDGQSQCPDGNTCCKLKSGQYGCCPQPDAVCCSDGVHCCPHDYKCDVSAGSCVKGKYTTALLIKSPTVELKPRPVDFILCPGKAHYACPVGSTCCKEDTGAYGCCPMKNAVCCSDHVHCCPYGYTCDLKGGSCSKGSDVMPFFVKQAALSPRQILTQGNN